MAVASASPSVWARRRSSVQSAIAASSLRVSSSDLFLSARRIASSCLPRSLAAVSSFACRRQSAAINPSSCCSLSCSARRCSLIEWRSARAEAPVGEVTSRRPPAKPSKPSSPPMDDDTRPRLAVGGGGMGGGMGGGIGTDGVGGGGGGRGGGGGLAAAAAAPPARSPPPGGGVGLFAWGSIVERGDEKGGGR